MDLWVIITQNQVLVVNLFLCKVVLTGMTKFKKKRKINYKWWYLNKIH